MLICMRTEKHGENYTILQNDTARWRVAGVHLSSMAKTIQYLKMKPPDGVSQEFTSQAWRKLYNT